jgi:HSP20 family protein
MDIADSKNAVKITTEIPGIDRKDLNVTVDGNTLVIRGEKKREDKLEEDGVVRTERTYGSFYRAVTLPSTVDASKIEAKIRNGVLTLTLPKREEAKPKQIAVDVKED